MKAILTSYYKIIEISSTSTAYESKFLLVTHDCKNSLKLIKLLQDDINSSSPMDHKTLRIVTLTVIYLSITHL